MVVGVCDACTILTLLQEEEKVYPGHIPDHLVPFITLLKQGVKGSEDINRYCVQSGRGEF